MEINNAKVENETLVLGNLKTTEETLTEKFAVVPTEEAWEAPLVRYSTTDDNIVMFNALNSASEKVEDYIGEEVVVEHIVVTSADVQEELNNPNAPWVNKPVIHFFCEDGTHIASLANGIRRTTMSLLGLGFDPTPEHPVVIKFKSVKVKKGHAHGFDIIEMR